MLGLALGLLVLAVGVATVVWTMKGGQPMEPAFGDVRDDEGQGRSAARPDALDEILAALNRDEPAWHLADLQRRRVVIHDDQNGALCVLATARLLPPNWPDWPGFTAKGKQRFADGLNEAPATARLTVRQMRALESELDRAEDALREARRLAELPRGRFPIDWAGDPSEALGKIPIQEARSVAGLLGYEALLHTERANLAEALTSCQAAFNAGRSLGDEPVLIAQLIRLACRGLALLHLERILARGEPPAAALARLQGLLADEAEQPLLHYAMLGERHFQDGGLQAVEEGRTKPEEMVRFDLFGVGKAFLRQSLRELRAPSLRDLRAALLRLNTQCVELTKLPFEEQGPKIEALKATVGRLPNVVQQCWLAFENTAAACRRNQTNVRCGVVGVAAERYRQRHGGWPGDLRELVPDYLASVPNDPHDGKPLRYRRVERGVVIYPAELDGQSHVRTLDRNNRKPGDVRGFRLWDVERRRQPAP